MMSEDLNRGKEVIVDTCTIPTNSKEISELETEDKIIMNNDRRRFSEQEINKIVDYAVNNTDEDGKQKEVIVNYQRIFKMLPSDVCVHKNEYETVPLGDNISREMELSASEDFGRKERRPPFIYDNSEVSMADEISKSFENMNIWNNSGVFVSKETTSMKEHRILPSGDDIHVNIALKEMKQWYNSEVEEPKDMIVNECGMLPSGDNISRKADLNILKDARRKERRQTLKYNSEAESLANEICDFYLGFQNKEEVQDKSIPRNFTTSYRELPKSFRNEISDGFLKNVKFERFRDLVRYLRKKSGILYLRLFGWTRTEKNKRKIKELDNKVYELTCQLATVKFTVLIMEREIKSLIKEDFHFE